MRMTKCKNCGKIYPANISNCPDCYTKTKLPTGAIIAITICCFIIALCVIAIIGIIASDETMSNPNTSQSELNNIEEIQYIEVSAADIYSAFSENEIAAEEKFKGKIVKITGIVNNINSKDIFTSANVLLDVDDSLLFGCVQCNFNSEDSKLLADIKKGEAVTIIGTCGGLSAFNVMINACELQK